MIQAYDTFLIDRTIIDAKKYTIDDRGFLHLPLKIANVGIMDYPEHKQRRYMPAHVLKTAAPSADYAVITENHEGKMISVDNVDNHSRGFIKHGSFFDGTYIRANAVIQSRQLIQDILDKNVVEVSAGYACELDSTPGSNAGGHFDVSFKSVKYNHVTAIHKQPGVKGRAGPEVKFEIDQKGKKMPNPIQKELSELKVAGSQLLSVITIHFDKESQAAMDTMSSREHKLIECLRSQDSEIITLKAAAGATKESMDQLKTSQEGMIEKKDLNALISNLLDARQVAEKIGLDCKTEDNPCKIKLLILEKMLPAAHKNLVAMDALENEKAVDSTYMAYKENSGFHKQVHDTLQALDGNQGFQNPAVGQPPNLGNPFPVGGQPANQSNPFPLYQSMEGMHKQ